MGSFAKEMEDEGEDILILDDEDMDDVEFVDEIEDFEYEEEEEG